MGSDLCRGFRRLRAASDFARGGKVTKTPPGTAPEEHRSGAPSRLSPDPCLRGLPLKAGTTLPARKTRCAWVPFHPAPLGA